MTSVVLSDSVTEILASAFEGKESLLDSVTGGFEYYESACNTPGHSSSAHYCKPAAPLFTVDDSGTLAPVDKNALPAALHIPAKVEGKEVKAISAYAFFIDYSSINDKLTSVTLPSTITSIGECAFYNCRALNSINIPASVTTIGDHTFNSCTSLTTINIPSSVTTIGNFTFFYCTALTSVTFADASKLTSIGDSAFSYCPALTSIEIPASVTSIGDSAFKGCAALTSVTFADASQLCEIATNIFSYCTNLEVVYVSTNDTRLSDSLNGSGAGTFTFHDSTTPCTNSTHDTTKPHYCKRKRS